MTNRENAGTLTWRESATERRQELVLAVSDLQAAREVRGQSSR
jgi:hypothetical protein